MSRVPPPSLRLRAILILVAIVALVGPTIVVLTAPRVARSRIVQLIPARVVPADVLPPVEPVRLVDLSLDEARAYNAQVPFVRGPNPAARAFVLHDAPEDLARATDCLAAAAIYEAGNDPEGQRAVVQVVLNRVRHPAFPKTVCGVVFEGQDRQTGCQFTFTCDGALTRWSPSPAMWAAARQVATRALTGAVYRPVGYATHYHTDWVVPYWQASLDKIAAVHSHLFFRWTGWWGRPAAFGRQVQATEPAIAKLAAFSDAHKTAAAMAEADAALGEAAVAAGMPVVAAGVAAVPADDDGVFLIALPAGNPDLYPAMATMACGGRAYCKVLGWTDARAVPASATLSPAEMASMAFSYLRDRAGGLERTLWNCQVFPRDAPSQCMRRQAGMTAAPVPASPVLRVPVLDGVRRTAPRPAATPTPRPTATP